MTQTEFLKEIRSSYLKARKYIYVPKVNVEILTRGTSHSISSISEDLFAYYCANKVINPTGVKIIIDPPLSFKGTTLKNKSEKKALLMRPDIALCKNDTITCLFDIKTDLGYKRKIFLDQAKERNIQMNAIKNHIAKINDGETKISGSFIIDKNIRFVYIIISPGNINKVMQKKIIADIRELENIDAFVLSSGQHLNSYDESPQWEINKQDFDALDNLLGRYLK